MRVLLLLTTVFLLSSCGSPSVTTELTSKQIKSLIKKDSLYELVIRDLSKIRNVFEEDPILMAEYSEYTYSDYLAFLYLLKDSAIALDAQQRGRVVALESFDEAKSKFTVALQDTLSKLKAIDANQITDIVFEKYHFTKIKSKYAIDQMSCFDFRVTSSVPIKAIRLEYSLYERKPDSSYHRFNDDDRYDAEFVANNGFKFLKHWGDEALSVVEKKAKPLGTNFIVSSRLRYQSYSFTAGYWGDTFKNAGNKATTQSFTDGEYKIQIDRIDIIDENDIDYRWPVVKDYKQKSKYLLTSFSQPEISPLSYRDSYEDDELYNLLRYFFNEPITINPSPHLDYLAVYNYYFNHVYFNTYLQKANRTALQIYISDMYGVKEYVKFFELNNELGFRLRKTIVQSTGRVY